MKYIAEIHESGLFRQSIDFPTPEEREKWVEQFKAIKNYRWSEKEEITYRVPYNPNLIIKFVNVELVPTTEFSVEKWVNSRIIAGRLDGNLEWPSPSFITGTYNTSGYYSGIPVTLTGNGKITI